VPEQEFQPPRRLARPYRPDRDDDEPPPWANLPPVRPARSGRPAGPGYPPGPGRPAGPGELPAAPGRPADPRHLADSGQSADPRHLEDSGHPGYLSTPFDPAIHSGPNSNSGDSSRSGSHRVSDPVQDEPVPQWAQWDGPEDDAEEAIPPPRTREPGGRALRAAARRRRRWYYLGGGAVVVVGAVLAVILLTGGRPGPASVTPGALITTFQPDELRQVPNACRVVPPATVAQYLPGTPKVASPLPVNGSAGSACNWTVDKPPLYRLMQVSMNAYAPNGLASGNGSATRAATDAYNQALQELQVPPKNSPSSRATVQVLSGFGSQAYSALQVFHVGGAVTDVATVMVRYHNVIVTVKLNGTEHSNKGNYGPVSKPQLAAAAMAFARAAEASLH
jgi:hypothetical protein